MRRRTQGGQSLVEVAFVLPILVLILLGIFDFGRAVYAYNAVSNAAREAVRLAIVDQNAAAVEAQAQDSALGLDGSSVSVTFTTCPAPVQIGCPATVTVDHQWTAITPIIGSIIGSIDLSSTTEMPIERVFTSP